MTRGVDFSDREDFLWDSKERRETMAEISSTIYSPFYLEKGKSYGDRLPNNASCILSVFNVKYGHQRKLNFT